MRSDVISEPLSSQLYGGHCPFNDLPNVCAPTFVGTRQGSGGGKVHGGGEGYRGGRGHLPR